MQWATQNDGELAGAFAAGGANAAFDELVHRHSAMVFRTCRRVTGNHQDAEDAMQQVFAALAQNAASLAGFRSLGGWLYSTAWHIARHVQRSQHARRRHETRVRRADFSQDQPDDGEALSELYRALEMLPPENRDAIVLHHLEGLTIEQAANVLACSPGTVASRLSRARAMMRQRLAMREPRERLWSAAMISWMLTAEWTTDQETVPVIIAPDPVARVSLASVAVAPPLAGVAKAAIKATFAATTGWTAGKIALAACAYFITFGVAATAIRQAIKPPPPRLTTIRASATASAAATSDAAGAEDPTALAPTSSHSHTPPVMPVPEPTILAPVALGALALRRRRA